MPRPIPAATVARNEISEAAHAVLDHYDAHAEQWCDLILLHQQLDIVALVTRRAALGLKSDPLAEVRTRAIDAAARLIDAIGELDRCIAARART